jgi:hypothetical protein
VERAAICVREHKEVLSGGGDGREEMGKGG